MDINKYIDHTTLKAMAQKEEIKKLCDEANVGDVELLPEAERDLDDDDGSED